MLDQFERLLEVERKYPVETWTASGIRIWPLLRIKHDRDWFFSALAAPSTGTRPSRFKALPSSWARCLRASLLDLRGSARLRGPVDALFLSDGVSFARLGGRWLDKFCDPILMGLEERGLSTKLVTPLSLYRIPRHTPSFFLQPWLDVADIAARLDRARSLELEGYDECRRELPGLPSRVEIHRFARKLLRQSEVLQRVLRKTRPRLALTVSYYGLEGMAFNHACRQAGVPSVDIQHGAAGDTHVAYGRWQRVPSGGYELMPEHYWCWTEEDAQAIARWAGPDAALVGGNPFLEMWARGSPLTSEPDEAARLLLDPAAKAHVLVTLQAGLADPATLANVLEAIRATPDWRWWIRLHPCMLEQKQELQRWLGATPNAILEKPSDLPLYSVLKICDLHLTHSSATVVEARALGVRSLVTHRLGAELFPSLLSEGWITLAESGGDIVAAGERLLGRDMTGFGPALRQDPLERLMGWMRSR